MGLDVDVERTSSSTIDLLFGKPIERVSCGDIRALVEVGASESPRLEFKEGAGSEGELRELIMKSVIGFLNSDAGEGMLILGVKGRERAEKLVCVPRELLGQDKNVVETKIRNWVFNYLASIPPMIAAPRVLIKVFDCHDCELEGREGWIILIYVKRAFDALYYSRTDNTAYQRRGSETRRLTIEEAIHIVNAKRQPILLVFMEPVAMEGNRVKLDLIARNIGSAPANAGVSIVRVHRKAIISPSFSKAELSISMYSGLFKLTEDQETIRFQVNLGGPYALPVFPRIYAKIGELEVSFKEMPPKEAELLVLFDVATYSELNRTIQTCLLILSSAMDYTQLCLANTEDYMGAMVFETRTEENEAIVCDKKGVRVERGEELSSLLKMLATKPSKEPS